MPAEHHVRCGQREYVVRVYPDGVVGIFDPDGRMVAGWPETMGLAERAAGMTEDDWCAALARIRQGAAR